MRKPSQRKSQITSNGGRHFGKGRPSSNGQRKSRGTRFQGVGVPTVAVPNLSDVDDRHVHHPENRENGGVRVTGENNEREAEPDPGEDGNPLSEMPNQNSVGTLPTLRRRAEVRLNRREKMVRRRQAVLADQRDELLRGNEKCDGVNETKQAQNDEARDPVGISVREKFVEKIVHAHEARENVRRSTSKSNTECRSLPTGGQCA